MPMDHFSLIAPIYDRLLGGPDVERLKALLRLPAGGWLLDGGGGTGRASFPLRPMVGHVVVSDTCQRMLELARDKSIPAVRSCVEHLPFGDGRFERVLIVDALHHFASPAAAIGDLVRVLKPGGRLVIEEFDLNRTAGKLVAWAEKAARMKSRFFRPVEICAMLAEHGLKTEVLTGRRLHAWIIADKSR
jgi:demethylmenaquinone methyltransferase/2-methoxy-6-polyprenyl-1,4-benzoquinol methylase